MSCAKMAVTIEMPFGKWTKMGARKYYLGGGLYCHTSMGILRGV